MLKVLCASKTHVAADGMNIFAKGTSPSPPVKPITCIKLAAVLIILAKTLAKDGYEQFVGGFQNHVDQFSKGLIPNQITE